MKKIYNKNAREKQLLEEAYGAVYERRNPDADEWGGGLKGVFPGAEEGPEFDEEEEKPQPGDYGSIEDLFTQKVWYIGDRGDTFEVADFEEFKPYILNWDTLLEIMDEENTEGVSERWEEVKFGKRSEEEEDNVNWDEKDEVDEVGGGMNAKEFASLRKTPL